MRERGNLCTDPILSSACQAIGSCSPRPDVFSVTLDPYPTSPCLAQGKMSCHPALLHTTVRSSDPMFGTGLSLNRLQKKLCIFSFEGATCLVLEPQVSK